MLIGAPFMVKSVQRQVLPWHRTYMKAISAFHAVAILFIPVVLAINNGGLDSGQLLGIAVFVVVAIIELLPFLLIRDAEKNN